MYWRNRDAKAQTVLGAPLIHEDIYIYSVGLSLLRNIVAPELVGLYVTLLFMNVCVCMYCVLVIGMAQWQTLIA